MRFSRLHGSVLAGAFFLASSRAHLRIPAILSGTVMVVLALSGCTAAGSSSIPEPASTPTPPPAATAESALHESTNPDTVAWLTIPGTNIDGPVQQGPDNDYYLRRDSDGNEDYRVCYFADADAIVLQNQVRASAGVEPLTWDSALGDIAWERCKQLLADFSHNGASTAENIAMGPADASTVISAWSASSGHYANMVNSGFTRGAIVHIYDGDGCHFWCATFG